MKYFIVLSLWVFVFFFTACASNQAKIKSDPIPHFSNSRSFEVEPSTVKAAAQKTLEELIASSNPATDSSVKVDQEKISTGWVYGESKDKYASYNFNGVPKRKMLQVRRKYMYSVSPSIGGSTVVVGAEEEVENIDLKTGEHKGWNAAETSPLVFDSLITKLKEKLRSQN